MKCLNRETLEYQVLKQVSGISGFKLDSCIRYYLDNFDRYPHLDEIPGADSSKSLSETLEIQNAHFLVDKCWIVREPNYEYFDKELNWYLSESLNVNDILLQFIL